MRTRLFLLFLLLTIMSCTSQPIFEYQFWRPTKQEVMQAEEVARRYAHDELGITKEQLSLMKAVVVGLQEKKEKVLRVEFYDPKHFPDWENMAGIEGGFPHYFAIKVDMSSWAVVEYYAEAE
jgi:hypothetical protein